MVMRFIGPRQIDFVPCPEDTAPNKLRVRSDLIGLSSGTELLFWKGEFPENFSNPHELETLRQPLAYPLAYGYSTVGRLDNGERVFAFVPHGDEVWVDPSALVPIGDLPAEDAVFLANMETAIHLYQTAHPYLGQRFGVWGLGVVGLLLSWIIERYNPGPLWGVDPLPARRDLAGKLNIEALPPEEARRVIRERTDGQGLEVAFELSGNPETLDDIFGAMAEEGRIILGSWYGKRKSSLGLGFDFHQKRLSLVSSQVSVPHRELGPFWNSTRRRRLALELVRELRPHSWITHRFPLRQAHAAYELLENHSDRCVQVVLVP